MKKLIAINGDDAIVNSELMATSKADDKGMMNAKMKVTGIYKFYQMYDEQGYAIGMGKETYTRDLIMQLYNEVVEAEKGDEIRVNRSEVYNELPF